MLRLIADRILRRAAAEDAISNEPQHQAVVRRWRWIGNIALLLGILALLAAILWGVFVEPPRAATPDLGTALVTAMGFAAAILAMILGWILRQKR